MVSQAAADGTVYHLLYDGHGNTRALLTETGGIYQRFAFDAWGNQNSGGLTGLTSAEDAATRLLYSGEQTDRTGLQYLRARYYHPRTGRFLALDPSRGNVYDPQSLHRYTYTTGDPILFFDPTGRFEGLVGLAVANSIASMLNNLTAQTGQAVAASLGADLYVDPLDVILSRDVGLLPDFAYDAIDRAVGQIIAFAQNSGSQLLLGATIVTLGAAVHAQGRQLTLFDKFARYNNEVAELLAPGVTQLIHQTLKHRGALRATAMRIHGMLDPIALSEATIALAEVRLPNGLKAIFASRSGRRLTAAQEQALTELGVFFVKGSKHAEQNIAEALPSGSTVERWGISRSKHRTNIMCVDCQELLQTFGGVIE